MSLIKKIFDTYFQYPPPYNVCMILDGKSETYYTLVYEEEDDDYFLYSTQTLQSTLSDPDLSFKIKIGHYSLTHDGGKVYEYTGILYCKFSDTDYFKFNTIHTRFEITDDGNIIVDIYINSTDKTISSSNDNCRKAVTVLAKSQRRSPKYKIKEYNVRRDDFNFNMGATGQFIMSLECDHPIVKFPTVII